MWDQDAIEPPPIRYFNNNLNPAKKGALDRASGNYQAMLDAMVIVNRATLKDFAAPCPMPKHVPKDAHMVRIAPCHGEYNNAGVFCALVKLTVGGKNVVDGKTSLKKSYLASLRL